MNDQHVLIMGTNAHLPPLVKHLRNQDYRLTIVSHHIPETLTSDNMCTLIHGDFLAASSFEQLNVSDIDVVICLAELHNQSSQEADARSTLAAMSMKKINANIRAIVEIQNPNSPNQINMDHVDEIIPADAFITEMFALSVINPDINSYRQLILEFAHAHNIQLAPIPIDYWGQTFAELQQSLLTKDKLLIGIRRRHSLTVTEDIINPNEKIITTDQMVYFDLDPPNTPNQS